MKENHTCIVQQICNGVGKSTGTFEMLDESIKTAKLPQVLRTMVGLFIFLNPFFVPVYRCTRHFVCVNATTTITAAAAAVAENITLGNNIHVTPTDSTQK